MLIHGGDTPADACAAAIAAGGIGTGSWNSSGGYCDIPFLGGPVAATQVCEPAPSTPGGSVTTVICSGSCTVTHVVDLQVPILTLTPAEGGQIAGAILLVWVVGWAARILIRTLRDTDEGRDPENES